MLQAYLEETEELMQKAEECIMSLETEYSLVNINELFRVVHTIKGSSHMVGYEDIGNLMHKLEDMLDYVRNGSILFDQTIVTLCFEGLDTVKKMLQAKHEFFSQEDIDLIHSAARISEMVEAFIKENKKEEEQEQAAVVQSETGIIATLLKKEPKGKNKYYVSFFIEEDAPMVSPILIMILKRIEEIGTLLYSSVSDHYFFGSSTHDDIRTLDTIISTDIDEVELPAYFSVMYVDNMNIVNLPRNAENIPYGTILIALLKMYYLLSQQDADGKFSPDIQAQIRKLMNTVYARIRGKHLFKIFNAENGGFSNRLKAFVELMNKSSTLIFLIHLSELSILDAEEIKVLIEMKKQLESHGIEMGIIVEPCNRRIINIIDSIKSIEEFRLYATEIDAVIEIFHTEDSFQKLSQAVEEVYHG